MCKFQKQRHKGNCQLSDHPSMMHAAQDIKLSFSSFGFFNRFFTFSSHSYSSLLCGTWRVCWFGWFHCWRYNVIWSGQSCWGHICVCLRDCLNPPFLLNILINHWNILKYSFASHRGLLHQKYSCSMELILVCSRTWVVVNVIYSSYSEQLFWKLWGTHNPFFVIHCTNSVGCLWKCQGHDHRICTAPCCKRCWQGLSFLFCYGLWEQYRLILVFHCLCCVYGLFLQIPYLERTSNYRTQ